MADIDIIFKCKCMKSESTVSVPERQPNEDIAHWVEQVMGMAISLAHRRVNPKCTRTSMEYAKLPLDNEEAGIGFAKRIN